MPKSVILCLCRSAREQVRLKESAALTELKLEFVSCAANELGRNEIKLGLKLYFEPHVSLGHVKYKFRRSTH